MAALAWLTAAKSSTNTTSEGAQKTVHEWQIISCETHHSPMGWTLIIASFKAQSIRMLSIETANENNCGEKAQNRSRDFIGIKITTAGHI